jgi:hypothetical protein
MQGATDSLEVRVAGVILGMMKVKNALVRPYGDRTYPLRRQHNRWGDTGSSRCQGFVSKSLMT